MFSLLTLNDVHAARKFLFRALFSRGFHRGGRHLPGGSRGSGRDSLSVLHLRQVDPRGGKGNDMKRIVKIGKLTYFGVTDLRVTLGLGDILMSGLVLIDESLLSFFFSSLASELMVTFLLRV